MSENSKFELGYWKPLHEESGETGSWGIFLDPDTNKKQNVTEALDKGVIALPGYDDKAFEAAAELKRKAYSDYLRADQEKWVEGIPSSYLRVSRQYYISALKNPSFFNECLSSLAFEKNWVGLTMRGNITLFVRQNLDVLQAAHDFAEVARLVDAEHGARFTDDFGLFHRKYHGKYRLGGRHIGELRKVRLTSDEIELWRQEIFQPLKSQYLSDSYRKAALARYILGHFELAVEFQRKAVEKVPSLENKQALAKYLARSQRTKEAKDLLLELTRLKEDGLDEQLHSEVEFWSNDFRSILKISLKYKHAESDNVIDKLVSEWKSLANEIDVDNELKVLEQAKMLKDIEAKRDAINNSEKRLSELGLEAKEIIEANQSIETQIENWTLYRTKIDEAEAWTTKLAEAKKATDILVKNEVISASIKTLAEYTELERQAKEFIRSKQSLYFFDKDARWLTELLEQTKSDNWRRIINLKLGYPYFVLAVLAPIACLILWFTPYDMVPIDKDDLPEIVGFVGGTFGYVIYLIIKRDWKYNKQLLLDAINSKEPYTAPEPSRQKQAVIGFWQKHKTNIGFGAAGLAIVAVVAFLLLQPNKIDVNEKGISIPEVTLAGRNFTSEMTQGYLLENEQTQAEFLQLGGFRVLNNINVEAGFTGVLEEFSKSDTKKENGPFTSIEFQEGKLNGRVTIKKIMDSYQDRNYTSYDNISGQYILGKKNGTWKMMNSYSNTLFFECNYKNDLPDGIIKLYDRDGTKLRECNYMNGVLNGKQTEWFSNRTLKATSFYVNGKIDGLYTKYGSSGAKVEEWVFTQGVKNGKHTAWFDKQAASDSARLQLTCTYRNGVVEGPYSEYNPNGTIKVEGIYEFGKKNGNWTERFATGELKEQGTYQQDTLVGDWLFLYQNGNTRAKGSYLKGTKDSLDATGVPRYGRDGKWLLYYENGKLSVEQHWKSGQAHGKFKTYFASGDLASLKSYTNGKLNGPYEKFYEQTTNGVVDARYINEDGKYIGKYFTVASISSKSGLKGMLRVGDIIAHSQKDVNALTDGDEIIVNRAGRLIPLKVKGDPSFHSREVKGTVQNGKYMGRYKTWYTNGQLQKTSYISIVANGDTIGTTKQYYPNGKLEEEYTTENRHYTSRTSYYRDGSYTKSKIDIRKQKITEEFDARGTLRELKTWKWDNAAQTYSILEGRRKSWDERGVLVADGYWINEGGADGGQLFPASTKVVAGSGVTDASGNRYKTVRVGNQEWMTELLRTTRYANGDPIQECPDDLYWIIAHEQQIGAWTRTGDDNKLIGYNTAAAEDKRGICPKGWRIPTNKDVVALAVLLGNDDIEAGYNNHDLFDFTLSAVTMSLMGVDSKNTPGYTRSNDPTIAGADNYIGLSAVGELVYTVSKNVFSDEIRKRKIHVYQKKREGLMEWLGNSRFITVNTSEYNRLRIEKKTCSCVK